MARLTLALSVRRAVHTLGVTQIIGWGTVYYLPTLLGPILAAEEGWSRTATFGAFSAALVVSGLLASRVGRRIDRQGGRTAMMTGSLLAALGLCILAAAGNYWVYLAGWLILGLAMAHCLYDPAFASLTALGGTAARPAITALTLYGGVASTIFWPVGLWVDALLGWRGLCLVFALLNLLVCLPLHGWGLRPVEPLAGGTGRSSAARLPLTSRQVLLLVLFGAAFVLMAYSNSALSAHMIEALMALGLSPSEAVTAGGLRGVGQVFSRVGEFLSGGSASPTVIALAAATLMPLAFVLPWLGLGAAGVFAFAMLQGAGNGLMTIARGTVPLAVVGPQRYGEIAGRLTAPILIAGAAAPMLHALLTDYAGHRAGLVLLGGLAAVSALLILLILRLGRRPPA